MNRQMKKLGRVLLSAISKAESSFDRLYQLEEIPPSTVHREWELFTEDLARKKGYSILEIGSREVTGKSADRQKFAGGRYVGFDYYPGANVNVVGDVHKLSSYFEPGEQFDVIYSRACFEHFAMPWLAAIEISKMLKVGGTLFVATHFSYAAHERPWNFFQFSDMGLKVLFSEALGFECLNSGLSDPIVGRFSRFASPAIRLAPVRGLYSGSEYFGRKVREVPDFEWSAVNLQDVVSRTVYPPPGSTVPLVGEG